MKVESVCFLVAIEWVTEDGSIQAFVVGTMHSQLMCSPRLRIKCQAEVYPFMAFGFFTLSSSFFTYNLVFRDGFLAFLVAYHLAWPVEVVWYQWERDDSPLILSMSILQDSLNVILAFCADDGDVLFLYLVMEEGLLQLVIGKFCLGDDQQSACRHVQSVYDERSFSLWVLFPSPRIDGRLLGIFSRNGEQAFWLVDDGKFPIVVQNLHLIV